MAHRPPRLILALLLLVVAGTTSSAQNTPLRVLETGPIGPLGQLSEASEIRVMFSEPMVPLGRVPANPDIPWVSITPRIPGQFRWSGTTILVFTPDPAAPVPFATTYTVSVDASATSAAGRRLEAPYRFEFTTPPVRLEAVRWVRRNGRVDSPLVMALEFNQRVRPADVLAHLAARYALHDWEVPQFGPREIAAMQAADPGGLAAFYTKVAATQQAAASTAPVGLRLAAEWDRDRFPPRDEVVILETTTAPPPEAWLALTLDATIPSPTGAQTPGVARTTTLHMEPAFFAMPMPCTATCDPARWNPVRLTGPVAASAFGAALTVRDITTAAVTVDVGRPGAPSGARPAPTDVREAYNVEDAGFDRQAPATTWQLRLDPSLESDDGRTLGYPWIGIVSNAHERPFVSFGDGHGVWESSGGPVLPFASRNFSSVTQWVSRLGLDTLMPTLVSLEEDRFRTAPAGPGTLRRLPVSPDAIEAHGLDLSSALSADGTGLVRASVMPGEPIEGAVRSQIEPRATVVQATNLGLSVKDSPQNTLIFVTRLDTGAPVAQAHVSVITRENTRLWQGTTGADGTVLAPPLPLRGQDNYWQFRFLVAAEKDGDVAYVGSDWNEGISPWDFGFAYSLAEANPLLRGSVFTDRGVYKPGEDIHVKAIVRTDRPQGIALLPAESPLQIRTYDSRNRVVDERTVALGRWSSAEWTWTVPEASSLGSYRIEAVWPGPGRPAAGRESSGQDPRPDDDQPWLRTVYGEFLVAAYRKPDFRVETTLTADATAGAASLHGTAAAEYLFGAALADRQVRWSVRRTREWRAPEGIRERYPENRYTFTAAERDPAPSASVAGDTATVDAQGRFAVDVPLDGRQDIPYQYTFEGEVEDVSRQRIANRTSLVVHPASFYVGLAVEDRFVTATDGTSVDVVAAGLDGTAVAGVPVTVALVREQWNSVRTALGDGFYEWETTRTEIPAGTWTATTAETPVSLSLPVPEGGSYLVRATARDGDGRATRTEASFYSAGEGYTAWERFDHNRITLTPERPTWAPGERARILIESPWESATALLTVEREGIRSHEQFTLTSTQQMVEVPITEADIPNLYVSVLLVRGRTSDELGADGSDPGKPAFRLGYAELRVEDTSKQLTVDVSADRAEYRPATAARVSVRVADQAARPVASEVTLWAVDDGVLALTDYQAPDVRQAVYQTKALQVMNADSRQRIVSRRVLTPKGEDDGGGGGFENVRQDFRPLAFWLGSVVTDATGTATTEVTLPEALTTYRVLAVAADATSRFGSGSAELRVSTPVTLLSALPRFLNLTDTARVGAVVTNTLSSGGEAQVSIRSLDPAIVEIRGDATRRVTLGAGASANVRFGVTARQVGRARIQMSVALDGNTDAFETTLPVTALARLETSAAFGELDGPTSDRSVQPIEIPSGIVPTSGGLSIDWASTALVGLGTSARYLADYPYGCAEQKASAALAYVLSADLGRAFSMGGVDPADYRRRATGLLEDLTRFQCTSGGFGLWPAGCSSDPYLTSYVLDVMHTARDLGMALDPFVVERALDYLEQTLTQPAPGQVQWWPVWGASQAYGVKVLAEYGRNQDSNITRLTTMADRLPVFAVSYLLDAMAANGDRGPRYDALLDRLSNAIRVEGDQAHVEELNGDVLQWVWHTNVRSTAVVLGGLARRQDGPALVPRLVRWLNASRVAGHWGSTQSNAATLQAMVHYYRAFESEVPDLAATATLGPRALGTAGFQGRSLVAQQLQLTMPELLRLAEAGSAEDLAISAAGTGRLFYTTRLQFAPTQARPALDQGIRVERRYESFVEDGPGQLSTAFAAGDLVRVVLRVTLPAERRYVAVTDPLPAGFEAVDGWFSTTAADLARQAAVSGDEGASWWERWQRGGFDHVEKFDDRVELFGTRLADGAHEYSYLVRATSEGTFTAAGTWAEQMYAPEVNGRGAPTTVVIR